MGALTDAVRRLLDSLQVSSASPGHINVVLQTDPGIDLDEALEGRKTKESKDNEKTKKTVEGWDKGQVGEVQRFSTEQFGNIKELSQNPVGFVITKVFGKFAKGVGIITLAFVIFEAVKFIISELLKPGRFLDRRFKRDINKEIIQFRRREDQQKLKQGFSNIIITTMSGLRGGQGQFYNTLDHVRDRSLPRGIGQQNILFIASGISRSKNKGSGRGSAFGGGPGG